MQAQKTVQLVSVRFIALAFALLAALLLASAAGYVIRGGNPSTSSTVGAPPTLHFLQQTDNQMERAHIRDAYFLQMTDNQMERAHDRDGSGS
jgi:hypothetical protein